MYQESPHSFGKLSRALTESLIGRDVAEPTWTFPWLHCRVQDFVAEDQRPRVSIALEQFYIPDELYQHAVEFDVIRPPGV